MKSILLVLALTSAPVFADQLHCVCTGDNFREEMNCDRFWEVGKCTFTDHLSDNVVWQKSFKATRQGILFTWSTNGSVGQHALLQSGQLFDFQYSGDSGKFTMVCNYSN